MAVGDLRLENFGTWRDAESRLAWGVNECDQVHPMPRKPRDGESEGSSTHPTAR